MPVNVYVVSALKSALFQQVFITTIIKKESVAKPQCLLGANM